MKIPFRGRHEISRRDAELLLDRAHSSPSALADLLAAAAGPPLPHETKGERAAVRRFSQAYGAPVPTKSRHRPHRVAALLTASAAAVLLGGTAYAAGSGHLPDSLQRTAHDLFSAVGVPAPDHPSASPSPSRSARVTSPSAGPSPSPTLLRELCGTWRTFENDPQSRPLTPDEKHRLGDAAGGNGKRQIDEFCAGLLGPAPSPSASDAVGRDKPGNPSPGPKKSHK
jgi:hypothetical protein